MLCYFEAALYSLLMCYSKTDSSLSCLCSISCALSKSILQCACHAMPYSVLICIYCDCYAMCREDRRDRLHQQHRCTLRDLQSFMLLIFHMHMQ